VIAVLYDEDCGFCRWSTDELNAWDTRRRLTFAEIPSAPGAERLVAVPEAKRLDSMHAVTPDGRVWSGGQGVRVILAQLPGGSILASIAAAFPVRPARPIDWSLDTGNDRSDARPTCLQRRPDHGRFAHQVDVSRRLAYGRGYGGR
jgi:predicted DCC family thiol-disulfide oxidoreductase YuxK